MMKIKKLALMTLLSGLAMNCMAAEMKVVNHATQKNQWFEVVVMGAPTSYAYVGAVGGASDVTETTSNLADTEHGQYKITEVKYCIDSMDACMPTAMNIAKFKHCHLQDSSSGPVNETKTHLLVRLDKNNECHAVIN